MKIAVKIYGCYELTYSRVCKDVLKRIYGEAFDIGTAKLIIEDISYDNGKRRSIQSQRSLKKYVTRLMRIYEDGKLAHIVAMSNTNYDYDKKREYDLGLSIKSKYDFGGDGYHANTYLKQGTAAIFNYYFANKSDGVKLSFYLLDTHRKYPHNLYNILSYRELETIGFKVLNIDEVDFSEYEECCNSKINKKNIGFASFDKYVRDIAYVSSKNSGNIPSFLTCDESYDEESGYSVEKYIYTFKCLSAQAYDSLFRCWCMKTLADRAGVDIEFRAGKQYYAFQEKVKKISKDVSKPVREAWANAGIVLNDITNEDFINEKNKNDEAYNRHREQGELRNQFLFRNNMRKKGMPIECVLCGQDTVKILDAAHIWEVNKIKSASDAEINDFIENNELYNLIDEDSKYRKQAFYKKYSLVNSGENGVWMCKNHHGLFDKNYFCFDSGDGKVLLFFEKPQELLSFQETMKYEQLPSGILTKETKCFIAKRQISLT